MTISTTGPYDPAVHQTAAASWERGRIAGVHDGYDEGYLRGRANAIVGRMKAVFPFRQIHVLYVVSGKGLPYSPLDEAVITTLQSMTAQVTVTDPRQPVGDIAAQLRPNLMLALDGMDLPLEQVTAVRQLGIPTAIWLTDDPYYTDTTTKIVTNYDYVFTLEMNCLELYRQLGCTSVHYLPFGAFLTHYFPLSSPASVRREIGFTGSAYWNRIYFFNPIMPQLMARNIKINGIWWDRLPDYQSYGDKIELGRWMSPVETNDSYNGSKIVINLHRSHQDDSVNNNSLKIPGASPNPRTFEISASGTLQLTDTRDDLARFYKPGEEIETYSSQQELLEKVEFYLTHEKERHEIALRALERTLREHTYGHRIDQLLSVIFP
ncbi:MULTISPECIES: CgeB family protein [Paenibacillus]|jgi:spore maturation protein CgeB|uniref:Glycosyltransferase n=4 Tax=Paenibacillus TaxID=44249 RepID=A0AAJ3IVM9_PAEPO|nr:MULTISPECIES: glycosyltransferase [Paenibacillus]AIW41398.1 spore maturation protein cgeB [Paenibacillus polymyxa CR1]ALA43671.1 spore maturation protein cgeB [Paenibacillus peoriae]APB74537.1 spore maturation protein cgeB [Paenibacillus polymyxa]APQ60967.1 spore maturation protein cgeB [Paenibacillus polymyxa]MBP1178028.1 spore maturation protein CgeB [Paenibacillus sp. PvR133]